MIDDELFENFQAVLTECLEQGGRYDFLLGTAEGFNTVSPADDHLRTRVFILALLMQHRNHMEEVEIAQLANEVLKQTYFQDKEREEYFMARANLPAASNPAKTANSDDEMQQE